MRKTEQHRRTASAPACLRRRFSLSNLSNRVTRSCCSCDAIRLLLPQSNAKDIPVFEQRAYGNFGLPIADCRLRIADCELRIADYFLERAVLMEATIIERISFPSPISSSRPLGSAYPLQIIISFK